MRRLYLLGFPIAHSISPALQNAALAALGLDLRYELREVGAEELAAAAPALREADCAGANVTIPHKETIIPFLDELGESAQAIGAVNTIVRRGDRLIGENTDATGFVTALRGAGFDPRGARALVLGAGGAARAAAFALGMAGARRIVVSNRTDERARALVADLAPRLPGTDLASASGDLAPDSRSSIGAGLVPVPQIGAEGARGQAPHLQEADDNAFDLIVDALPPGVMVDFARIRLAPGAFAYDLAYRPAETEFMRRAAAAGARPVGGLGMLVHQAAAALGLWTGRKAPTDVMFAAAEAALGRN